MHNIIGWVGAALLAFCAVPQAIHSVRQGHSHGVQYSFLVMWLSGEILTAAYVLPNRDWPLLANYTLNIALISIIIWFKIFPRSKQ